MRHESDFAESQGLDHRGEIAKLLLETVGHADRLVGRAKTQKIKRNDTSTGRYQVGNKVIVDAKIVGEAVHKHEGRTRTVVVARVNVALAARNVMLGESRLAVHGALVEAGVRTAASRRQRSAEKSHLDWTIVTLSLLKNRREA